MDKHEVGFGLFLGGIIALMAFLVFQVVHTMTSSFRPSVTPVVVASADSGAVEQQAITEGTISNVISQDEDESQPQVNNEEENAPVVTDDATPVAEESTAVESAGAEGAAAASEE